MTDYLTDDLYGFTDDNDQSLIRKEGGNFGLNEKAHIIGLELKEDQRGNPYIELKVQVGDKEYQRRFYDVGAEVKYKGKMYPKGSEEYEKVAALKIRDLTASMTHILKALGVTKELLQTALTPPPKSFKDYFSKLQKVIPQDYKERNVDVFLQYQAKIRQGQDRTWLELPWGMMDGYWITPHIEPVGQWTEVIDKTGIKYTDEAGNEHPIQKSKSFIGSGKDKLQEKKSEPNNEEDDLWV